MTPTVSPAPTATAPAATATPASVIPRTADSFPLALLIGLAIVSCGALGILYTAKKRRKEAIPSNFLIILSKCSRLPADP